MAKTMPKLIISGDACFSTRYLYKVPFAMRTLIVNRFSDMKSLLLLSVLVTVLSAPTEDDSFSFQEFSGPVSGEVLELPVSDKLQNLQKVDYVAKPDYSFAYGVQDDKTGNSQTHKETRDGDTVRGEYRVLQADGVVRIVRYTADAHNGFQATVDYAPLT